MALTFIIFLLLIFNFGAMLIVLLNSNTNLLVVVFQLLPELFNMYSYFPKNPLRRFHHLLYAFWWYHFHLILLTLLIHHYLLLTCVIEN